MEGLAAISLAGNIVQFVDFACELLSNCRSLYRSANGYLSVNAEIALITTDLRALVAKWRYARNSGAAGESTCLTQAQSEEQKAFESICDGAEDVAKEIIARLESLKMEGNKSCIQETTGQQTTKRRKLDVKETIKKAVKSLWTKEEIKELVKRLGAFKDALQTRVIVSLRWVYTREYLLSDF
jgi:hypothetical protein